MLEERNPEVLEPVMDESEEEIEEDVILISTTIPPPTRAAPLLPNVATGMVPPNPYPQNTYPQWDFAQAAEVQRKRANCTNVLVRDYKWGVRCAQPQQPHQILKNTNKTDKTKIKFISPNKPDNIPKNKHKKKIKTSKHIKQQHKRAKKNKQVGKKIKFKSPFKPSFIPNTMKKKKEKKLKNQKKQKKKTLRRTQ